MLWIPVPKKSMPVLTTCCRPGLYEVGSCQWCSWWISGSDWEGLMIVDSLALVPNNGLHFIQEIGLMHRGLQWFKRFLNNSNCRWVSDCKSSHVWWGFWQDMILLWYMTPTGVSVYPQRVLRVPIGYCDSLLIQPKIDAKVAGLLFKTWWNHGTSPPFIVMNWCHEMAAEGCVGMTSQHTFDLPICALMQHICSVDLPSDELSLELPSQLSPLQVSRLPGCTLLKAARIPTCICKCNVLGLQSK